MFVVVAVALSRARVSPGILGPPQGLPGLMALRERDRDLIDAALCGKK